MIVASRLPPGYALHAHERVGSTNDVARALALEGAPAGQVVTAVEQSRGRGRYGRTWASPPGNLYASVLLRPACAAAEAPRASLVAALALADALEVLGPEGLALTLKWPNDVLLDGAKAAGILLESGGEPDGRCAWVVIGTGVNVAWCPDDVPYPATTLRRQGFAPEIGPAELLEAYIGALDAWLGRWQTVGFAVVRERWLARGFGLGGDVRLRLEHEEVSGRFVDLSPSGALLLEQRDGRRREIAAGDVFYGGA